MTILHRVNPYFYPALSSADFRIFIGHDSREPELTEVCAHSLQKNSSRNLHITSLDRTDLINSGFYYREYPEGSTEFTYSRFLVPFLCRYSGWAMFCDSDFLFTSDIREVFELKDDSKAVMVVQRERMESTKRIKMDGSLQSDYPMKNWSSLMLFNCGLCRKLTIPFVNTSRPDELHQFKWTHKDLIGKLPPEWNYLVGHDGPTEDPKVLPKGIHFTEGGPWFPNYRQVEFTELWLMTAAEIGYFY